MSGKLGIAPCGHVGEHVTPRYVTCPRCDAVPKHVEPEETPRVIALFCPHCCSRNIGSFDPDMMHCWNCGKVW